MKRFASAAIVMALCLAMLPGQAVAAKSDLDGYQTILTEFVAEHGIYMPEAGEDWIYPTDATKGGLLHAELVDFDGDGGQELYLTYLDVPDGQPDLWESAICDEVWSGDRMVYQGQLHSIGGSGDGTHSFARRDGKVYLVRHDGRMLWNMYEVYRWNGSEFAEVASMQEAVSDFEPHEYTYTITEDGKQTLEKAALLSPIKEDDSYSPEDFRDENVIAFFDRYGLENMEDKIGVPGGGFSWYDTDLSLLSPEAVYKNLLRQFPYIGEVSNCKMTFEQAMAYLKILEDCEAKGFGSEQDDLNGLYANMATLVDFNGDGVPFLLVNYWSRTDAIWILELWCYEKGAAIKLLSERNTGGGGEWGPVSADLRSYSESGVPYLYLSNTTGEFRSNSEINHREFYIAIYRYEAGKLIAIRNMNEVFDDETKVQPGPEWFPVSEYDGYIWARATLDGTFLESEEQLFAAREQLWQHDDMEYLSRDMPISDLISLLSQITPSAPTSSYPYAMGSLTDAQIAAIAKALADRLGGEVTGVYQLADDLYYVVVTLPGGGYGGAVVKETRSGFRVLQAQETPLDDAALAPFAAEAASKPNLTVDYGQAGSFSSAEDYITYLGQLLEGMDGTAPNDPARAELATYAETAVSRLSGAAIRAKRNHVTVTGASIESAATAAREARDTFNRALTDSGVTLNKPITILLRIEGQNLDSDKPIQLTLDQTVADAMGEADAVQILLGDGRHSVKLTAASLRRLLTDYGAFSVQLAPAGEGVYTITFADGDGNTLDKLPTDVAFALPAESPFATVLASYQGGSDNWGGQYDGVNGTLEFSTKYSGQYEILKNDLDIADLGGCSDETQAAIRFMASKGYFDLTGDAFSPNDALTRYDFTTALVKMFFALDRSLGCTFPDVPADSPYLPYVASAEHGNIVEGYTDGTFSGGDSITGEQVLALCARTLAEQKGYRYPDVPADYLNFSGAATTSEWAKSAVAVAIREGLVTAEESFDPVATMTRAQSALVLYRMFMLLYETSPVAFSVSAVAADFPVIPVAVGGTLLLSCGGGGAFLFLRKKKGSGIEEEEREG